MTAELFMSNARGRRASRASIGFSGSDDDLSAALRRRRPSLVVDGLSIVNVIRKKRDGDELSDQEIEWFVSAATKRLITDAQIGTMSPRGTIRYDTRCYFNVRSKADMSQLNLPHGNDN